MQTNFPFDHLEDLPDEEKKIGRKHDALYRKLTIRCQAKGNTDPRKIRYRCSSPGCEQNWSGNRQGSRIFNHIIQECKFVAADVKAEVVAAASKKSLAAKTTALVTNQTHQPTTTSLPSSSSAHLLHPPPAFDSFSQAGKNAKRDLVHHAVLKFFCAALLPPSVADLDEWKALIAAMDCKVPPVSSTTISDIQLVHESAHALQQSLNTLKECYNLTLTMDGGSTRAPVSIYTIHVTTAVGRESHLISGVEDSGQSHTAEWCENAALEVRSHNGRDVC